MMVNSDVSEGLELVDVFCEICKRRITKSFTFVDCAFFEYHSKNECGGCDYPVGNECIKKVPEEFRSTPMSVLEWSKMVKEMVKNG